MTEMVAGRNVKDVKDGEVGKWGKRKCSCNE